MIVLRLTEAEAQRMLTAIADVRSHWQCHANQNVDTTLLGRAAREQVASWTALYEKIEEQATNGGGGVKVVTTIVKAGLTGDALRRDLHGVPRCPQCGTRARMQGGGVGNADMLCPHCRCEWNLSLEYEPKQAISRELSPREVLNSERRLREAVDLERRAAAGDDVTKEFGEFKVREPVVARRRAMQRCNCGATDDGNPGNTPHAPDCASEW